MTRLLILCLLLTGCRSCAERRAERAYSAARDELSPALDIEPVEVLAEQVERDDGGVEAWGDARSARLVVPDGWTLTFDTTFPDWSYDVADGRCPDDVPLVGPLEAFAAPLTSDANATLSVLAGGCDSDGDDIRGTYDAGFTLDVEAANDGGDVYQLTLAVPVVLTIE